MAARRARLDAELVRRGLAPSRAAAQELIAAGAVRVGGAVADKPARQVSPAEPVTVVPTEPRYASRGGLKLAGALDDLGLDVTGRHALDAGAAHGGFTDVLLRRGVASVVAVDVAYGQLAWHLRTDERVTVLERTNVRHLTADLVPGPPPDLVVGDLSFISLTKVLPALVAVAGSAATFLPMVKPQFEVGPDRVGSGGVVRRPEDWRDALSTVVRAAAAEGLVLLGAVPSRTPGPAGNLEFFLHLVRRGPTDPAPDGAAVDAVLDRAVTAATAIARSRSRSEPRTP